MNAEQIAPDKEVELLALKLVASLQTGDGWRKEHGRISRLLIIREGVPELKLTERAYRRATKLLEEQGYAVSFYCRPHGDEPGQSGYVELGICIGR